MNRQAVIEYIQDEFDVAAEYLWMSSPDCAVFRNKRNQKWFAIIMNVNKTKLGLSGEGGVDVINVKCDPILIGSLLCNEGYRPAYHMNKTNWITVLLDGSVNMREVKNLIRFSYEMIETKNKL